MIEVVKITQVSDKFVSVMRGHFQQMDKNTGDDVFKKLPSNMEKKAPRVV